MSIDTATTPLRKEMSQLDETQKIHQNSLELQIDFQAVESEERHGVGDLPHLHETVAVELRDCPMAMFKLRGMIVVRVVLVLLRVFAGLVVTDSHLHPVLFQVVEVRRPALLQELEERLLEIGFPSLVESRQIFNLELAGVQLLLVGKRCEKCAVRELVPRPVRSSRPNLRVTQNKRESFTNHLIFRQRLVSDTFSRVDFLRVGNLEESADEVRQTSCHFRFVLELLPGAVGNVTAEDQILRVITKRNIEIPIDSLSSLQLTLCTSAPKRPE
jgi:hypothetical protein